MSDSSDVPADAVVEAVTEAARRRRQRRRAFFLALLILALIPTALQIELRGGGRLSALRILGPVQSAGGGGARAVGPRRTLAARAPVARPIPLYYGAVREARPTDLELRSGLAPGGLFGAAEAEPTALISDPSDSTVPAPSGFSSPGVPISFNGGPVTVLTGPTTPTTGPTTPSTPTPPVTGPVTTTPVTPPVTTPPVTTPPVITPPVTNPTPPVTNPVPPVVIIDPPPTGPGGPQVITPVGPGGTDPGGPSPVTGAPEPATWIELVAGFGLAGALIRRRRQPATALRARSSALTAVSRLG